MIIIGDQVRVIDSHTGGEPTRVVLFGGPRLDQATMAERRERFRLEHDAFRAAVINEPRGSDVLVGALLCPPVEPNCATGVIFFNNVGYLGMCGHGIIGLVVTLGHIARIAKGTHRIDTPVGVVSVEFDGANRVAIDNVPSYRHAAGVTVAVDGVGPVTGDVAWGGNWFFLVDATHERLDLANVERLTDLAWRIRQALARGGVTGAGGAEIDHIELFGPPHDSANHSRNFVLCPGKAYDRSPCGTGTSAKLACLVDDGNLASGDTWRQESIVGSVFEGSVSRANGQIIPRITGTAFVHAHTTLLLHPADPFRKGIHA